MHEMNGRSAFRGGFPFVDSSQFLRQNHRVRKTFRHRIFPGKAQETAEAPPFMAGE
jgi:hypothetical protein